MSTIGALGYHGLIAELCFEGTLTSHLFNYFIETMLAPKLKKGNVLIAFKCIRSLPPELREMLTPKGVKVMFLPQDEPELNPIELIWSQVKRFLKKHTAT